MLIKRLLSHLLFSKRKRSKLFGEKELGQIAQAIEASEKLHRGELFFVIEHALSPLEIIQRVTPEARALRIFGEHRVWDTEDNTGILIYLLLADRRLVVLADRGINKVVSPDFWKEVTHVMEIKFKEGKFTEGTIQGISMATEALQTHFPPVGKNENELRNMPTII